MKTSRLLCFLSCSIAALGVAHSALGLDYPATATINTAVNTAESVNVGYKADGTMNNTGVTVTVGNGGSLALNGGSLNIGSATALNDSLVVEGTGTLSMVATSGKNINMQNGSGQSITVQGGGTMALITNGPTNSGTFYMGSTSAAAPNKFTVTGSGSTFTNGTSTWGANLWFGSNTQVEVSNGGTFTSLYRGIYLPGRFPTGGAASNSSLLITGAGSMVTTNNTISVGYPAGGISYSASNMTMTISNGGEAYSGTGYIAASSGSNNNSATITGNGSLWDLKNGTGNLYLGSVAGTSGNTLNVSNGGLLNNVGTLLMAGTDNHFNLGNGALLSKAAVNTVTLGDTSALLNIDNGQLIARADGALVSGSGKVELLGPAYVKTLFASTISSLIEGTSAAGTFTKEGSGTLTLSAANTYIGDTTVSEGTLSILAADPWLSDTGAVKIALGAKMDLQFTGIDAVGALWLDGSLAAPGTWGGTGSGATHIDPVHFGAYSGQLLVAAVPEPSTMVLLITGLLGLVACWRKRK